jgi:restriction system protein
MSPRSPFNPFCRLVTRGRRRQGLFRSPPIALSSSSWNPESNLLELERRVISPEAFRSGVVLATDPFLIRYLDEHPKDVYGLSPREFEKLVAGLLARSGYTVKLGPQGRDGGIDVFAERDGEFGPELTLVQCKRYRGDQKVSEPTIKQLYGDLTLRNATKGLLVTTSSFTKPALKLIEDTRYRLAGTDFEKLRKWMAALRKAFK